MLEVVTVQIVFLDVCPPCESLIIAHDNANLVDS